MDTMWKFCGACVDGEDFRLDGVNVWKCEWERVPNTVAAVRDPHHDQPYKFNVYDLVHGGGRVRVAAGEFSNCIWGFYIPAQA